MKASRPFALVRPVIASLALTCTACVVESQGEYAVPLSSKTDPSWDPTSLYAKAWPGQPSLVKLSDDLILAIPPQYHQFWTQRDWRTGRDTSYRLPMNLQKLPQAKSAGFTMHLPNFEGYTPTNYLKDFDENRVEVLFITPAPLSSMEPGAAGSHAPNSLKRLIDYRLIKDPQKYEEKYGLRCYEREAPGGGNQFCYGKRDSDLDEYLLLEVNVPPYGPHTLFPQMSTKYFSSKYGGLEIAWRTHMTNWPLWRQIDSQIWKYIEAWNIAPRDVLPVPVTR